jgi:hypothetical protein
MTSQRGRRGLELRGDELRGDDAFWRPLVTSFAVTTLR